MLHNFQRRFFSSIQISKFDGKDAPFLANVYKTLKNNLALHMKENKKTSLTLSEKILYSHLENPSQK